MVDYRRARHLAQAGIFRGCQLHGHGVRRAPLLKFDDRGFAHEVMPVRNPRTRQITYVEHPHEKIKRMKQNPTGSGVRPQPCYKAAPPVAMKAGSGAKQATRAKVTAAIRKALS